MARFEYRKLEGTEWYWVYVPSLDPTHMKPVYVNRLCVSGLQAIPFHIAEIDHTQKSHPILVSEKMLPIFKGLLEAHPELVRDNYFGAHPDIYKPIDTIQKEVTNIIGKYMLETLGKLSARMEVIESHLGLITKM
jgi:hypothetical protein